MKINLYDTVLLKDGITASIVEIFEEGKVFLADIGTGLNIYTDYIYPNDIVKVI